MNYCKQCPYNNGGGSGQEISRPIIAHPQGNFLQLMIPLDFRWHMVNDGVEEIGTQGTITADMNVEVILTRGKKEYRYKPEVINNQIIITDKGNLPLGTYDIIILIDDDGNGFRYKMDCVLRLFDAVAQGVNYENDEINVFGIYPIIEGKITAISISDEDVTLSENGKFQGDDTPNDNYADITAIYGDSSIEVGEDDVTITI